jgi:hypothetical protein
MARGQCREWNGPSCLFETREHAFGGFHGRVHDGVELHSLLVHLDILEGSRYAHEVHLEGLGTTIGHGSYV